MVIEIKIKKMRWIVIEIKIKKMRWMVIKTILLNSILLVCSNFAFQ